MAPVRNVTGRDIKPMMKSGGKTRQNLMCNKQTWVNDTYRESYRQVEWDTHPKDCRCARCFVEKMDREETN